MRAMGKFGVIPGCTLAVLLVLAGCHHQGQAQSSDSSNMQAQGADPADGNLAPANGQDQPTQQAAPPTANQPVQYAQSDSNQEQYAPPPPPDQNDQNYDQQQYDQQQPQEYDDQPYDEEPAVQAAEPPPMLPEYSQPPCPGDNYMWTPGYWYWGAGGYYWVPGAWVLAPFIGALWTPGYWYWGNGFYRFHRGYWGPYIGFYGGVNYGYGYTGRGYYGGYWDRGSFRYNRSITNVNTRYVRNVYSRRISNDNRANRVSYNGGRGGINARPTSRENVAARDRRMAPLPAQVQHVRTAASNRQMFAKVNHGRPARAAVARPLPVAYKAPAARPPAIQRRPVQQNRPNTNRPGITRPAENRPANRPSQGTRPAEQARPQQQARPEQQRPQARPQQQQFRPEQQRPQARPEQRPQQQFRPEQQRPQARPEQRPQQQFRPEQQRPQARPEQRPQQVRPQARPQQGHTEQRPPQRQEDRPH